MVVQQSSNDMLMHRNPSWRLANVASPLAIARSSIAREKLVKKREPQIGIFEAYIHCAARIRTEKKYGFRMRKTGAIASTLL